MSAKVLGKYIVLYVGNAPEAFQVMFSRAGASQSLPAAASMSRICSMERMTTAACYCLSGVHAAVLQAAASVWRGQPTRWREPLHEP